VRERARVVYRIFRSREGEWMILNIEHVTKTSDNVKERKHQHQQQQHQQHQLTIQSDIKSKHIDNTSH
jgi:hypothetical protein